MRISDWSSDVCSSDLKLYDSLPPMEKNRIKKIDVAAAEKLLAELKAKEGGPTQKIDSTVGERASKPQPVGNLGRTLGNGNRQVMTTFSQLVDTIMSESRRPDLQTEIATYINQTVRELHFDSEQNKILYFNDNMREIGRASGRERVCKNV